VSTLLTFSLPLSLNIEVFLNVTESVNSYVHGVSFVGGFLLGTAWVLAITLKDVYAEATATNERRNMLSPEMETQEFYFVPTNLPQQKTVDPT
jgi:hypothetical protein